MAWTILEVENDVVLSSLPHPSGDKEVFKVTDRRRTPEDWVFNNEAAAREKFDERVEYAKTDPPSLPR